ncbi:hypothetical protein DY000_02022812 [Brassica cretica]|uniref:Uncharacterized protein n=1 Tax=Brassica cretica TaxID=69181 RepID=A0ABQ7EGT1_BRACR|nr:hypothetical protein DY000_02022812 [Brassica cretica]
MYSRFVYKRELNDELLLTLEEINQEDIGYRVVVYETVSYNAIDQILRQRYGLSQNTPLVISHRLPSWMLGPQGNRIPPATISSTAELSWLLHWRTWISELPMLIMMGPKDVAEYEFHCRTNFAIGNTTYVFDHTANENSRAAYENSLRLFHRVSLEMAFADNFLANQQGGAQPVREIIELDDDDTEMDEVALGNATTGITGLGTEAVVPAGEGNANPGVAGLLNEVVEPVVQGNATPGVTGLGNEGVGPVVQVNATLGVTGLGNEVVGPVGRGEAPPVLWDVGMDMTAMEEHRRAQATPTEGLDDGMMFWARMATECLAGGGRGANVNINDDVGSVVGERIEPCRQEDTRGLSPSPDGLEESECSYTDSTHANIGPLTQPTSDELEAARGLVLATTTPVEGDIPMGTEPTASKTLAPMVKLAMFCATKGEGSTNPKQGK